MVACVGAISRAAGNRAARCGVEPHMTNTLNTDFEVMHAVAAATDTHNEEIHSLLQGFINRMRAVPATVWAGAAAARFHDVVDRWNAESLRLHRALAGIAETIRHSERLLREAAEQHSHRIGAAGDGV